MVKFLWDECILHDFIRYMYKQDNYTEISKSNLTYQKANNIVKNFISEDLNRINLLKYKIEQRFPLIHYINRCCLVKFRTEQTISEFKIKRILIFIFKLGKIEKLLERLLRKF